MFNCLLPWDVLCVYKNYIVSLISRQLRLKGISHTLPLHFNTVCLRPHTIKLIG